MVVGGGAGDEGIDLGEGVRGEDVDRGEFGWEGGGFGFRGGRSGCRGRSCGGGGEGRGLVI